MSLEVIYTHSYTHSLKRRFSIHILHQTGIYCIKQAVLHQAFIASNRQCCIRHLLHQTGSVINALRECRCGHCKGICQVIRTLFNDIDRGGYRRISYVIKFFSIFFDVIMFTQCDYVRICSCLAILYSSQCLIMVTMCFGLLSFRLSIT